MSVSWKKRLLTVGYVVAVVFLMLVVLEWGARYVGLGQPVLYYNAAWGGIRPLPDQQIHRQGATVTVDANGFRTNKPDQPGALRILYIGDSVTWGGTRIDDSAIFTEVAADVVRARRGPVYTMNAGVNGTGLVNQAELFLQGTDSVEVLVWLFPWSDVQRAYATVGPLMPARYRPRWALVEFMDHMLFRYWLRAFRHVPTPEQAHRTPEAPLGYEDFFQDILLEREQKNLHALRVVLDEATNRHIPVVLGITPYRSGNQLEPLPVHATTLLDSLSNAGVPILDVPTILEAAEEPIQDLFTDHVHFTEAGHAIIGKALGDFLGDRTLGL